MEIKGKLDATDWFFLLQNVLFAQHVLGTIMHIIRSSTVIQMAVVLGSLVYRSLVWCGAVVYVSGLRDLLDWPVKQYPANGVTLYLCKKSPFLVVQYSELKLVDVGVSIL